MLMFSQAAVAVVAVEEEVEEAVVVEEEVVVEAVEVSLFCFVFTMGTKSDSDRYRWWWLI